jgi:hypothetical protein
MICGNISFLLFHFISFYLFCFDFFHKKVWKSKRIFYNLKYKSYLIRLLFLNNDETFKTISFILACNVSFSFLYFYLFDLFDAGLQLNPTEIWETWIKLIIKSRFLLISNKSTNKTFKNAKLLKCYFEIYNRKQFFPKFLKPQQIF